MEIQNRPIGNDRPFFLIAGPCVIESEAMAMKTAEALTRITSDLNIPFVYKSSYDKANRTSIRSFRGPGKKEGLRVMEQVKREFGIPITSDVHNLEEIGPAAEVLDILQIPAFLCRQTDLILAAAETNKMVNIKKGQFLAPWDMKSVLDKATSSGNRSILLTERGTSFGYNNLVTDIRSLVIMREWGYPVVFDATHSVQLPGGKGESSGGQREFVPYLMRAAVSVGVAGIFIEVHPDPDNAPSDGPNMLKLDTIKPLLEEMIRIEEVVKPIEQRTSV